MSVVQLCPIIIIYIPRTNPAIFTGEYYRSRSINLQSKWNTVKNPIVMWYIYRFSIGQYKLSYYQNKYSCLQCFCNEGAKEIMMWSILLWISFTPLPWFAWVFLMGKLYLNACILKILMDSFLYFGKVVLCNGKKKKTKRPSEDEKTRMNLKE